MICVYQQEEGDTEEGSTGGWDDEMDRGFTTTKCPVLRSSEEWIIGSRLIRVGKSTGIYDSNTVIETIKTVIGSVQYKSKNVRFNMNCKSQHIECP